MTEIINSIFQGLLLGGLYGLFAAGLSLMFGVMRFINLAHGDFIVAAAFGAFAIVSATGLNPLVSLVLLVPGFAFAGYCIQRVVLNRVIGRDIMPGILVTFGFSVMLQNLMLEVFSANSQRLDAGWLSTASVTVGSISVGLAPLLTFAIAVALLGGLGAFLAHTSTGRLLRATSDDSEAVGLMGADRKHLFALATALASGIVALAGVLMAIKTNFDPSAGPIRLLFAFEAVIIGGLGSLWGTLIGGIVLGVAQGIGAAIDPGYQILAGHVVFLIILVMRPQGLFARQKS